LQSIRSMTLQILVATFGIIVAQADLPNANLPGNSATLPNSNLPGSVPTDNPITLPNTDTSRDAQHERALYNNQVARIQQSDAWQQQTLQLAAKAVEESALAHAEATAARQATEQAAAAQAAREAMQQQLLQQQQTTPAPTQQR
jgi:hypothetical protein